MYATGKHAHAKPVSHCAAVSSGCMHFQAAGNSHIGSSVQLPVLLSL
jgi:hypothetical protein